MKHISCNAFLLMMNSLSFFTSKNKNLQSTFIFEGYFHWVQYSRLTVLFFQYFRDVAPLSSGLDFSNMKSTVIFIFVLVHHNMSLLLPNARLLATFVILLFIITVEQFEYDVFLCNFFLFVCLFCFGFTELLALWVDGYLLLLLLLLLLLFAKFGKVLAVISSSIFFFFLIPLPLSSPLLQQLHTGILNCLTI